MKTKHRRIILLVIAFVSFLGILSFSLTDKNVVEEKYNFQHTELQNYFKDGRELNIKKFLRNKSTGIYNLGPGQTSVQKFTTPMRKTKFVKIYLEKTPQNPNDLDINIVNKKGKVQTDITVQKVDKHTMIFTLGENYQYSKNDYLEITNNSYQTLSMLCHWERDGSQIDGQSVDLSLIMGFNGYKSDLNIYLFMSLIVTFALATGLFIFELMKNRWTNHGGSISWKNYAIELVLGILTVVNFFLSIINLNYLQTTNFTYIFMTMIFGALLVTYMIKLLYLADHQYHKYFVIIAIPLGLLFWLFVLPDCVPDEEAHFAKMVLTSQFHINNNSKVALPNAYNTHALKSYYDVYLSMMEPVDYHDTYYINAAAAYPFYCYVPSALFFDFGKILHIPLYANYFLARLANLIVYIWLGHKIVKTTPVAKLLFTLFLLSPINLQQGASLSIDLYIVAINTYFVAYVFKVRFSDEVISWKDIGIIGLCFFFTMNTKYVYAPIYALLLILWPKFKEDKFKKVLPLLGLMLLGAASYFLYNMLLPRTITMNKFSGYLENNNVHADLQKEYLMKNPQAAVNVVVNSWKENYDPYLSQAFGGMLGETFINMNPLYLWFYALTMFIASVKDTSKYQIKITSKILMLIIIILTTSLAIIGLYMIWTPVAYPFARGVQGRYFLPVVILFMLLFQKANNKDNKYIRLFCLIGVILFILCSVAYMITCGMDGTFSPLFLR